MDRKEERALVKKLRALIKEVDAGRPARAAWMVIQDGVKQLYDADTSRNEIARLLNKSASGWVKVVLAWDRSAIETPFAGSRREQDPGQSVREAKKAMTDQDQRQQVADSMSEKERLEAAAALLEPTEEKKKRRKKDEKAVREERVEDPLETPYNTMRLDAYKAKLTLKSMLNIARDYEGDWTEEYTAQVHKHLEDVRRLADLVELSMSLEVEGIDWDAELSTLVTEE